MRSSLRRTCVVAIGLWAISAWADSPTPTPTPARTSGDSAAVSSSAQPDTTDSAAPRVASPRLAATLSAGISYHPLPPKKKLDIDDEVDAREVDKPRNGIVRLPKVVVEGEKPPPIFSDRSIYTKKGLAELATKRYLSSFHRDFLGHLAIPFIGATNEDLAMMMYEEDERLKNLSDAKDKIYLYRATGNTDAANQLTKDAASTFMRRDEYVEPMAPPSR